MSQRFQDKEHWRGVGGGGGGGREGGGEGMEHPLSAGRNMPPGNTPTCTRTGMHSQKSTLLELPPEQTLLRLAVE